MYFSCIQEIYCGVLSVKRIYFYCSDFLWWIVGKFQEFFTLTQLFLEFFFRFLFFWVNYLASVMFGFTVSGESCGDTHVNFLGFSNCQNFPFKTVKISLFKLSKFQGFFRDYLDQKVYMIFPTFKPLNDISFFLM
jgi:hypothetical protein